MAEVSPDLFLNAAFAYQQTAAIKAALALDLFTAIAEKSGDPGAVAARTGASEKGVRVLCDYLTIQGFLEKGGTHYRLTPSTQLFLTRSSPAFMGGVIEFLAAPEVIAFHLDDPVSYVRKGGAQGLASLAPDNPAWVKFAKAMVPLIMPPAQALAAEVAAWPSPPAKVLDVAAGHGMFGIALAKAVPQAEITALDWPSVLAVAEENAKAAGVAARYRMKPGSAFDVDWGDGFDLVLLTNFLHHFDEEICVSLLVRARASLKPGGRVIAVDMVPNEDRVSPPFAAKFAFVMLGSTPHGDAYTARQFEEMGRKAGFGEVTLKPLPPSPMSLISFA
jgi:ubiquinone/menaquinone biosynthesis C-methylase UbiE